MSKNIDEKSMTMIAEYHSNSDIRIKHIKKPTIGKNEALVKMEACGICGTDVLEWYRKKSAPKILGHEMSGIVVEVGKNVSDFKNGDRVFVSHHVPCFDCYYCDNNKHSACDSLHSGNFYPGGFSEYIKIPEENLKYGTFKLPDNMTFDEAAMIEPMACAVAGQKMLKISSGQTILILGSGISGLCHTMLAKMKGLKVITTDISSFRIKQAYNFGSDYSLHADELTDEKLKEVNGGRLADIVINCTGSDSAIKSAFNFVDKKGQILIFAVSSKNIELSSVKLWRNEISVIFSYGAATNEISETIKLYAQNKINLMKMISHRIPLSEIVNGFKLVESANESIKVVINPDN